MTVAAKPTAPAAATPAVRIAAADSAEELEADRIADAVMRGAEFSPGNPAPNDPPAIHRQCDACASGGPPCADCAENDGPQLMLKRNGGGPALAQGGPAAVSAVAGGGRPLPKDTRAYFEPRFGTDLADVRIHTDKIAASAATGINARAYALGDHIAFSQGQFAPFTNSGRRLIAHELAHVVAQPGGTNLINRDITFEDKTAEKRHTIVDPTTGKESRSDSMIEEFRAGARAFLGLELTASGESISKVKELSDKKILQKFKKRFPATLVQTKSSAKDKFDDVNETISFGAAKAIFSEVRKQVVDLVNGGTATIRAPENQKERDFGAPVFTGSSGVGAVFGGSGSQDIVVQSQFENLAVRKDVAGSFDGFWILLHEFRHRAGKTDAKIPAYGGAVNAEAERPLTARGKTLNQTRSMIGEVVGELNVLRHGFSLPIRTTYSDSGFILFSLETIGENPSREEIVGVNLADSKGLSPPKETAGERKDRLVRERVVGDWTPRLAKVKTGTVETAGADRPMDISLTVSGSVVKGKYSYESGGKPQNGTFEGFLSVEKSDDAAKISALRITVTWEQNGMKGKGFWKTNHKNETDIAHIEHPEWPDRLVEDNVVIDGKWGVTTDDGGGSWSLTLPGRSKRATKRRKRGSKRR